MVWKPWGERYIGKHEVKDSHIIQTIFKSRGRGKRFWGTNDTNVAEVCVVKCLTENCTPKLSLVHWIVDQPSALHEAQNYFKSVGCTFTQCIQQFNRHALNIIYLTCIHFPCSPQAMAKLVSLTVCNTATCLVQKRLIYRVPAPYSVCFLGRYSHFSYIL